MVFEFTSPYAGRCRIHTFLLSVQLPDYVPRCADLHPQASCYLNRKKASSICCVSAVSDLASLCMRLPMGLVSITAQGRGTTRKRANSPKKEVATGLWPSLSSGLAYTIPSSWNAFPSFCFQKKKKKNPTHRSPTHMSPLRTLPNWGHCSLPCTFLHIIHFLKKEQRLLFAVHLCCWMGRKRILIHLSIPKTWNCACHLKET